MLLNMSEELKPVNNENEISDAARILGRKGGKASMASRTPAQLRAWHSAGGKARQKLLSPEERKEFGRQISKKRGRITQIEVPHPKPES